MGDRINKALAKLSSKERGQLEGLLRQIIACEFQGLDLKKLKGHTYAYRVRKGDFRIIFTMASQNDIRIIALERRTDTTYRER